VPWEPLTDEQLEIRELVRTLARDRIGPRAAEIDQSHEFPWDVVELYREHGIFGLLFDEEHGGTGSGTLLALVAIEEVSKVCATSGLILAVQELGSLGLKLAGNEDQKTRFLPLLASGEVLAAYALTEAGSGSDSAAMRTTARRDGDDYVLDGSKRFITNAAVAGLYTVFAKTDPDAGHSGISAFLVESATPGFEVARLEPKMGIAGSTTGELIFDGARCAGGANRRPGRRGEVPDRHAHPRPLAARRRRAGARRIAREMRPTTRSSTRGTRRVGKPIASTSSSRKSSRHGRRCRAAPRASTASAHGRSDAPTTRS
jgi:alkylation response protein AidB-like acyl-CoA dehydrogenase